MPGLPGLCSIMWHFQQRTIVQTRPGCKCNKAWCIGWKRTRPSGVCWSIFLMHSLSSLKFIFISPPPALYFELIRFAQKVKDKWPHSSMRITPSWGKLAPSMSTRTDKILIFHLKSLPFHRTHNIRASFQTLIFVLRWARGDKKQLKPVKGPGRPWWILEECTPQITVSVDTFYKWFQSILGFGWWNLYLIHNNP